VSTPREILSTVSDTIHLRSALILSPMSHNSVLPLGFPNLNSVCISLLIHASRMPRPSHPPSFDDSSNSGARNENYESFLSLAYTRKEFKSALIATLSTRL
jgi:hypothetical protein